MDHIYIRANTLTSLWFSNTFVPCLLHTNKQQSQSKPSYCVLLILTDGVVNDLVETKRKLETYSAVPLSVIIVGIGRNDFQDMYILCQENTTFVEFRRYQNDPSLLATAALTSFPNQVVDYMTRHGIYPPAISNQWCTHWVRNHICL